MLERVLILVVVAAASLQWGCSTTGPGLANHPLDCAMGKAWDDCQPGTAGYNNGGGQTIKGAELQRRYAEATAQCKAEYQTSELDPIRSKVEFLKESEAAPPFEIASNDTFPTESDRAVIAKFATLRDACVKRWNAAHVVPGGATPLQAALLRQGWSFGLESGARVGELLIALYQQKMTYGEFAQKRYEITLDRANRERQFHQATAAANEQRQLEAQRFTQQQAANDRIAWAAYLQAMNARQPKSVQLNCTSLSFGDIVSTNCN
jgi:hypothetical protein